MNRSNSKTPSVLDLIDTCVMCGMCLPYCPTYQISSLESESPRGRISLVRALAQEQLPPDQSLVQHLDNCLGCMACQDVCPSKVPYQHILDAGKTLTAKKRPLSIVEKLTLRLATTAGGFSRLFRVLTWLDLGRPGLISGPILAIAGKRENRTLLRRAKPATLRSHYPSGRQSAPQVALFTGCLGCVFDMTTLLDAIEVLNKMGFDVSVPKHQGCCGAMHRQQGDTSQEAQLATNNRRAFTDSNPDHVVFCATGCGQNLKQQLAHQSVHDIVSFVLTHIEPNALSPIQTGRKVLIHQSCSSTHKLHIDGQIEKLVTMIPNLDVQTFREATHCCGAGGLHQLSNPQLAQQLAAWKAAEINDAEPDILLSDNFSCSLNIQRVLDEQGTPITIMHPVSLLARALKW